MSVIPMCDKRAVAGIEPPTPRTAEELFNEKMRQADAKTEIERRNDPAYRDKK